MLCGRPAWQLQQPCMTLFSAQKMPAHTHTHKQSDSKMHTGTRTPHDAIPGPPLKAAGTGHMHQPVGPWTDSCHSQYKLHLSVRAAATRLTRQHHTNQPPHLWPQCRGQQCQNTHHTCVVLSASSLLLPCMHGLRSCSADQSCIAHVSIQPQKV